jgi:MFS family permease
LTLASFQNDYRYGSGAGTRTNSLSVGLQQLGAFVACFLAWPLADKLGRKKSLMLSSFVFAIGAVIQTINTHSLTAFYIARVIAGLGLGAATVVVPMFNSEMMPKEMRGQVGSFFQWFFTFVCSSVVIVIGPVPLLMNDRASSCHTSLITASPRVFRTRDLRNGRFLSAFSLSLLLSLGLAC